MAIHYKLLSGSCLFLLAHIASAEPVPAAGALLAMVHEQAKQLSPIERTEVLDDLAIAATALDRQVSREWAMEMYEVAKNQIDGQDTWQQMMRAAQRKNALTVLSFTDPEAAAERFFDLEPSAGHLPAEDPRVDLSRHLFVRLWSKEGRRSLPAIRRMAAFTAETGEYPYAAMGLLIPEVARVDRRIAQELFAEAVRHLGDQARIHRTQGAYLQVLRKSWMVANQRQRRAAARAGVLRAQRAAQQGQDGGGHFYFRYYLPQGTVRLDREVEAKIYDLLPFLDDSDKRLGARLREEYPRLREVPVVSVGVVPWRSAVFASAGRDTPELVEKAFERADLQFLPKWAAEDAARAVGVASSIKSAAAREEGLALVLPHYERLDATRAEGQRVELARDALSGTEASLAFLEAMIESEVILRRTEEARRIARRAWKVGVGLPDLGKLAEICGRYWFGDEEFYTEINRAPDVAARLRLLARYARGAMKDQVGYEEPN